MYLQQRVQIKIFRKRHLKEWIKSYSELIALLLKPLHGLFERQLHLSIHFHLISTFVALLGYEKLDYNADRKLLKCKLWHDVANAQVFLLMQKPFLFYFERISSHGLLRAIQRQYEGYLTFYCLIQGHIMDHIVISYSSYSHIYMSYRRTIIEPQIYHKRTTF